MPKYEIGRYEVEITGQGFQKASTGTMQLVIQFSILGKVDPHDTNTLLSVAPGERKYYKSITANTLDWVMEDLKALGVTELASWSQLDPQICPDGYIDLTGKKVDMLCGSKVGTDGKSYEDWSIAREGGPSKPIENADKKEVSALDRLFGKHLLKKAAAGRQSRTAPARCTFVTNPKNGEPKPCTFAKDHEGSHSFEGSAQLVPAGGVADDEDTPF